MIKKIFIEKKNIHNILLIKEKLKKYNLCVLKNFYDKKHQLILYKFLKKSFQKKKDIRVSGDFIYKMKDFKRLDLGDSYINTRFARFMSINEWEKNNKPILKSIEKIINVRNKICNYKKENFVYTNIKRKEKNFYWCDAIRMIQYPTGGGYLSKHKDNTSFYPPGMVNCLLPISSKNKKDKKLNLYEAGGIYYYLKNKKIILDDHLNTGDLILHTKNILHGVHSVDPQKKLDLERLSGRITINLSIIKFYKN